MITGTRFAVAFRKDQSITIESGQAALTPWSERVVDALDAVTRRCVTVSDSIGIHVAVAVTLTAQLADSESSFRITVVTIDADIALHACKIYELTEEKR